MDDLGVEIAKIALPAALALTADPIASLVDTAFIGQIGAIELAAVGVSIAVFNQVSRIAIFPLVSITTSFVAEEDAVSNSSNENLEMHEQTENKMLLQQEHKMTESPDTESLVTSHKKKQIPSASSALIIGSVLGFLQAAFLIIGAKPVLGFMGIKSVSTKIHVYFLLRVKLLYNWEFFPYLLSTYFSRRINSGFRRKIQGYPNFFTYGYHNIY
ncbi:putative multi antimicrobial extrusion protein DinF [Helianthus annuus]|nr:putative multi antimicrobial extrusion protein DinF [Helianthus annuus]